MDVFGKCGLKKLPKTDSDDEKQLDVYRKLLRPYFFYFSFENTRCQDYISEKFYNVLATKSAIPVVFGPSKIDYEKVAPPHSFIHISDFKNASTLTDYLFYLSENSTAYTEYFWWTSYYDVRRTERICSVCEKLYEIRSEKRPTKRIKNFNSYWVQDADCNNPETAPW